MTNKINGGPKKPGGPNSVDPTKSIESTKVSDASQVGATEKQSGTRQVRKTTRPISAEEREHLLKLIREESDRIFGPNGLPESERDTVEGAVTMAIDASVIEEEEDN